MSDYLVHHGIKGQRWGIRRFQEEDGSLTDAGRKRYAQYKDLTTRDKAAYRKASKAFGRKDISADEIRAARNLTKRQLKKMKADMDRGLSVKEASRVANKRAAISNALIAGGSAAVMTIGANAVLKNLDVPVRLASNPVRNAVGAFVGAYAGIAINNVLYDNTRSKKRHGVGE